MVYFYRSDSYNKNLAAAPEERMDVEKKILELSRRQKIQEGKNPKWYDKGIWVLKLMGQGRNSRVIFQEIFDHGLREDYQLIVIRDYVSQKKYEPYWRARIEPMVDKGDYLTYYPLSDQEKILAIQALNQEINKPEPPKEEVPNEMANWLYDFGIKQHFSVYESPNWSDREHLIKSYIGDLFSLIKKILLEEGGVEKNRCEAPGRSIWEATYESVTILYEKTGLIEEEGKDILELLFLHNWWARETTTEDIESIRKKALEYPSFQGIENELYTRDLISKGAYRGYPGLIFKQNTREVWERIQTNSNKSNLALAPEQEDILKNFQFPSFINGQAGSGKSEMLMYLFAELCFRKECDDINGNVVFLTENEELLERAILDAIEKLSFNSQYSSYAFDRIKIKNNFNTFRGFILENLIDTEYRENFKESKYIDFSVFKQRYQDSHLHQNIKKKYPAEIAWFIIMTFIRGYDAENDELTPEKFEQVIHRRELSFVDNDTYKEVYEKIWKGFYKKILKETEYWDRLSLVRHVLRDYVDIPADKKYSVIVCDEAQDFTKLELQLLINLSRYSDYDLSSLNRVPIAFAGDPFQTVNPTGINLRQIRKLFWDELVNKLNVNLDIDSLLSNLNNNYRSTPEIVNLANALQYIRHRFLRLNDLDNPQTPRKGSNDKHPSLFRLEESESEGLEEKLRYAIFIAPCNQGEEELYKRNDDWLDEEMVLKSAALAKGSEYPIVCIYKFGEEFVREFGEDFLDGLLSKEEFYDNLNNGEQFRVNFLFNKLYVAITRAQNELYILDTSRGSRYFWKHFRSHENLMKITETDWRSIDFAESYHDGNAATVGALDFKIALQNATSDEDSGLLYEDKGKMRDAARMYGLLGSDYKDRKEFCLAKALEFERSYKEAGDKFRDCGIKRQGFDRREVASKCYWIGGYWTELLDLHGNDADKEEYKIRNMVARLMLNKNFDIQTVILFGKKIQAAIREEKSCTGKIDWEEKFYDKLIDYIKTNKEIFAGKISDLALALDSFSKKTNNLNALIADLYFADKNFKKAMEKWQEIDDLEHSRYWQAAAEEFSSSDPDKAVFYLSKIKEDQRIINIYNNNNKILSQDSLEIISDLFYSQIDEKSRIELINIYHDLGLPVKALFERLRRETKETKIILIIDALANKFISLPLEVRVSWPIKDFLIILTNFMSSSNISMLTSTIKSDDGKGTYEEQEARIKLLLQSNDWINDLMQSVIRIVAHSSLTVDQTQELLSVASYNYLHNTERRNRERLEPLEVVAYIDKVFKKFAEKQRVYSEIDGFLMRDEDLDPLKKMIIERRFWKIRYERIKHDFNAREKKSDKEIESNLENTKKFYPQLKFQLGPPSISYLRRMPEFPVVDILRDELEIQQNQKRGKTPKPTNGDLKNNDMQELKEMISHLTEQMKELHEQNKELRVEISALRDENRLLNKRNQELQEKLLKLL